MTLEDDQWQWVGKDLGGDDRGLFKSTVPVFAWRGKSRETLVRIVGNPTENWTVLPSVALKEHLFKLGEVPLVGRAKMKQK
jgi:hypothetical protein